MKKVSFLFLSLVLTTAVLYLGCKKTMPTSDFSGTPTTVYTDEVVNYSDLSSGSPTSWLWTFPGGTPSTSSSQNPNGIKYSTAGSYNVTLEVTNKNGSNSTTKNSYVTVKNRPAKIMFWTQVSAFTPMTIMQNGSSLGQVTVSYSSVSDCGTTGCVTVDNLTQGTSYSFVVVTATNASTTVSITPSATCTLYEITAKKCGDGWKPYKP